jgi:hypothetical protein
MTHLTVRQLLLTFIGHDLVPLDTLAWVCTPTEDGGTTRAPLRQIQTQTSPEGISSVVLTASIHEQQE